MRKDLIEELYNKYYKSAFAYVYSLCGNKEVTEDVVSQGFEKAILTLDDNVSHFKYWLMRVCKNLYIDHTRHGKKISSTPINDLEIAASQDVYKEVLSNIENAELYKALESLGENEKETVELFYFSNLSIKEISMLTETNVANTKVKLYRARLKLRKIMEESK